MSSTNTAQPAESSLFLQGINGNSSINPPSGNANETTPIVLNANGDGMATQADPATGTVTKSKNSGESDILNQLQNVTADIEQIVKSFSTIVNILNKYFDDVEMPFLESIIDGKGPLDLVVFNKKENFLLSNRNKLNKYLSFVNVQYSNYITKTTKLGMTATAQNQTKNEAMGILEQENANLKQTMVGVRLINKVLTQSRSLLSEIVSINADINQFSSFNQNLNNSNIFFPAEGAPQMISIQNLLDSTASMFGSQKGIGYLREVASQMIAKQQFELQQKRIEGQLTLPKLVVPSSKEPSELIKRIRLINDEYVQSLAQNNVKQSPNSQMSTNSNDAWMPNAFGAANPATPNAPPTPRPFPYPDETTQDSFGNGQNTMDNSNFYDNNTNNTNSNTSFSGVLSGDGSSVYSGSSTGSSQSQSQNPANSIQSGPSTSQGAIVDTRMGRNQNNESIAKRTSTEAQNTIETATKVTRTE